MTKTSTISISKFAYSFVSGENLGKEAIFCQRQLEVAVGDVLFALVWQLLLHGRSSCNLDLKICILFHSRAGCLRRNIMHTTLFLNNVFFVMAEALMAEEKYLVHASPVLTKNLRQWGLVQSACQRDIQRPKDKSSNHQSVQVFILIIYMS